MTSGVSVNEDCKSLFHDVKMRKCDQNFLVMKLSDDRKEVVIDTDFRDQRAPDLKSLLGMLPDGGYRYVIYDYPYKNQSGTDTTKLIMIIWSPESAGIKQKMVGASTVDGVKAALSFNDQPFHVESSDDITDNDILVKVKK